MTNESRSRTTVLGALSLTLLAVYQAVLGQYLMAGSVLLLIVPLIWRQRLLGDSKTAPPFRELASQRSHAAVALHLSFAAALIGLAIVASFSLWLLAHAIAWTGLAMLLWATALLYTYLQKAGN